MAHRSDNKNSHSDVQPNAPQTHSASAHHPADASPPAENGDLSDDLPDWASDLRPSAIDVLARKTLLSVLPKAARNALVRKEPIVVLLETSSAEWTKALRLQIYREFPSAERISAEKAPSKHSVPETPKTSGPIVAVSQNDAWLSQVIAAGCDYRLRVKARPAAVAETIGLFCGRRIAIESSDIAGLDLADIAFAIRPRATAASCRARLRRAVSARSTITMDDKTPPLARLVGYGDALGQITDAAAAAADRIGGSAGGDPVPSLLLWGEPGTGKTTIARSFARTLGLPLVVTSVAEWFSRTDGHLGSVTAAAQAFVDAAAAASPSVAFMDELDALPNRSTMSPNHAEWWTTMITQVLLGIDHLRARYPDVALIAATNYREKLDAALIRAGRFDVHIEIKAPADVQALSDVLRQHLGDDLIDVDVSPAAQLGFGATGATAQGWVRAARRAAAADNREMTLADLVNVIAPPDARLPHDRMKVALHEAAHAIVGRVNGIDAKFVSIVETMDAGGLTRLETLRGVFKRDDFERHVLMLLAGRAADELLSGGADSGAASDLARATNIVAALHCSFGLTDGLVTRAGFEHASDILRLDPGLREIVGRELDALMDRARRLVEDNEEAIRRLARALIARRVVFPADIEDALKQTTLTGPQPVADQPSEAC